MTSAQMRASVKAGALAESGFAWHWASALVFLSALSLAFIPHLHDPLTINEGIFSTVAMSLDAGRHLYTETWDHKPPFIFLAYRLAGWLGGYTELSLRAGAAVMQIAIAGFLWKVTLAGKGSPLAAFFSLLTYSILLMAPWAEPWAMQCESLQSIFILCAIWVSLTGHRQRHLLAGALWAAAFLSKQTALAYLPIFLVIEKVNPNKSNASTKFLAGANVMLGLVFAYFAATGRAKDFWMAVTTYNLYGYLPSGWKVNGEHQWLISTLASMGVIFAFSLLGLILERKSQAPAWKGTWLLCALLVFAICGMTYGYYFLALFPPLALAAGFWLSGQKNPGILAGLAALPLLAFSAFGWTGYAPSNLDKVAKEAGTKIAALAKSQDEVLVWGRLPQVHAYSGIGPTGTRAALFSHSFYLPGESGSLQRKIQESRPSFVVVSNDLPSDMSPPEWLREILASSYGAISSVENGGYSVALYMRKQ